MNCAVRSREECEGLSSAAAAQRRRPVIALIDGGIDTAQSNLRRFVRKATGFSVKNGYVAEDSGRPIHSEHGTAMCLAILAIAEEAEFISINILNERLATDFRVMLYALHYALGAERPDIVHMSLSSTRLRHYFPLRQLFRLPEANQTIFVASVDDTGRLSFPAFMREVVGVRASSLAPPLQYCFDGRFYVAPPSLGGIAAAACLRRQDYSGNSVAAAFVTGHIAKMVRTSGWIGRENILAKLREGSAKLKIA